MANTQPQPQVFQFRDRRPDGLGDLRVLPDEIVCCILEYLSPRDVARLSCVSSVMYILCNEEPLWMSLCMKKANGQFQYKGSWKKTTLHLEQLPLEHIELGRSPLHFDGFNSLFLYRRLYRCHTSLEGFTMDSGNVERKEGGMSLEEFQDDFDGRKPVLLTGLADTWPARKLWTIDQLVQNHGDTPFRISQRSPQKILMKLKDYISYTNIQHDEDPLYIFDDKFGEIAPALLKEYNVPHLFQEDFFDVLDEDQRPPFRWLIIGPERSGASWHVDPALTSAWNTLLCGRKRWALYPPGKVPAGVTVHVNDEDGDVNVDGPSSLQWWLDYYPLLSDEEKPIECTQLPGETIFVPSGWWHCVLNLETTIAVTQNFVNPKNFGFVCLDMAPGYRHKGVSRVGLLAVDDVPLADVEMSGYCDKQKLSCSDLTWKEKRSKIQQEDELEKQEFSYDIDFLAMFLDIDRDHYNSPWSPGNCIGPREMREWLFKLWAGKPGMRELIWKGACLALNAGKWYELLIKICEFHNLPHPTEEQKLPVGTGSNPVYLLADDVVKIFIEGGLENAMYCLGTELEFYSLLNEVNSPLGYYMPEVLASGILYFENGSYVVVPWDGRGIPDVIAQCNLLPSKCAQDGFHFGLWDKKQRELKKPGTSMANPNCPTGISTIWPYVITKRCKGKIFAQLRDTLTWQETSNLASFLGEQLRNLHLLPLPVITSETLLDIGHAADFNSGSCSMEIQPCYSEVTAEWEIVMKTLSRKKMDVSSRLKKWGDPIPSTLINKVDEYLPGDLRKFLHITEGKPSWIHSDIMDDNIHMEPCSVHSYSNQSGSDVELVGNGSSNGHSNGGEELSWRPSHILDFSDLSIGDPLCDLIPIHLDIFRGDTALLKQLLQSYRLPLLRGSLQPESEEMKFTRLSYRTMCYCILHDENVLGAIFGTWKELRQAQSWEEVEQILWGDLNTYHGFP